VRRLHNTLAATTSNALISVIGGEGDGDCPSQLSFFQFSHIFAGLKRVISAHSLSKLLQYLLNKHATSAELCSLSH